EQTAIGQLLTLPTAFVIVPLDGSPEAESALEPALAYARKTHHVLLLVRVLPVVSPAPVPEECRDDPPHIQEQMVREQDASRYLRAVRERVVRSYASHACAIQSMLLCGEPAEALAGLAARHAGSLIVMTARDRRGLGRLFLGSVAARLMRLAEVP